MPTGGNKDEIPPKLKQVSISRGTSTTIQLLFDENVVLLKPELNIILSPAQSPKPQFRTLHNKIEVQIDTTLPQNFYLQILSDAIQDLNEKNPFTDTILAFNSNYTADSTTSFFRVSGKAKSSYTYNPLTHLSVYATTDPLPPHNLTGNPFTHANNHGVFLLPLEDSTNVNLVLLQDNNRNHHIDSGEIFDVLTNTIPITTYDTSKLYLLSTDIPLFIPKAERTNYGYIITGLASQPINASPLPYGKLANKPFVRIQDTLFLFSDSISQLTLQRPFATPIRIKPKQSISKITSTTSIIRHPSDSTQLLLLSNTPIQRFQTVLIVAGTDSTNARVSNINPFVHSITKPSTPAQQVIIPDSSITYYDNKLNKRTTLSIPAEKDSVTLTITRPSSDTAHYILFIHNKQTAHYLNLQDTSTQIRIPAATYDLLIFHDADRNGFITPASISPLRAQEYHYQLHNYTLRKGIDAEERILPQP